MRKKFVLVFVFLCTASSTRYTQGQTAADIEAKYGKSLQVHSVSEHIWMTPEYAPDGQVCRMRLYPKRISDNTNYGTLNLPIDELRRVLNILVPVGSRGPKQESFGTTATGGGAAWTTYSYENVTFTFTSFFQSRSFEGSTLKRGEYIFSPPENEHMSKEPNLVDDDFGPRVSTPTEIVTVRWNGRKCIGQ